MTTDKCAICGASFPVVNRGRRRLYCSRKCRDVIAKKNRDARYAEYLRSVGKTVKGETAICRLPLCSRSFVVPVSGQKFCSTKCRHIFNGRKPESSGAIAASLVYFGPCRECQTNMVCVRNRANKYRSVCRQCRPKVNRAINTRKNHARRAAGSQTMSVHELARRDGATCNICRKRVDMTLPGTHKNGPTVDHLLPVSLGGTNDPHNLALAHRKCNVSRKADPQVQLLLEA